MPLNRGSHISAVIEEVKHLNPSSILDVGVGWGLMGAIFRAYTDIRLSELKPDRYNRFETVIDGIEIFSAYQNALWTAIYNVVMIGEANSVLRGMGKYDLIYVGDVIEHMDKEIGHQFIKNCLEHGRHILIATPSPAPHQGELLGNKFETHLSSWDQIDFVEYPGQLVGNFGGILVMHLWPKVS